MLRRILMASVAPVLVMAAFGGVAHAQQAAASAQPATLGEVVVTAQRRSENLQKAAVSVDAVSGVELTRKGVVDPTGLSGKVPGLNVPDFGGGTVSYFIRGVGNFSETAYGDPAIAFNYDNIYLGFAVDTAQPFYDLQRVEVLKGPQGTLYGRNATGGAINVIPQTPQLGSFGGYITASAGNYSAYNVQGAINVPIGDSTALRLAGDVVGHGPYLSDGTSDQDTKSFRAQVLSDVTPKLKVRIAADYTDVGGVGTGAHYLGNYTYAGPAGYVFHPTGFSPSLGTQSPASEAYFQTLSAAPSGRDLPANYVRPFIDNKLYGTNAEISYETPAGVLTVIPAYRKTDADFGYGTVGIPGQTDETLNQYSVEARFAGHRISIFDYTLGFLYYRQTQVGTFDIDQGPVDVFQNFDDSTNSYAAFGRITANVTDKLRLVGGVRYTVDDQRFSGHTEALTLVCPLNQISGCPTAPQFPFTTSPGALPFPIPALGGPPKTLSPPPHLLILSRADTIVPGASLNNSAPTFRGAVEYDVAAHSLLYASVETGYRAGGFNLAAVTAEDHDQTYSPEHITAYTIGSKNRFMDNRLELNAELFMWKYTNQQVNYLTEDPAGNNVNLTQNVGASTNQGAEIEGRYLITPLTAITANVQYLDATYNSYVYVVQSPSPLPPTTGCPVTAKGVGIFSVNCSGKPAYNAPKYTLNFGIEQTIPIDGFKLVAAVNTLYMSSRYIAFDYLPQELAPPVWQTSAELTLTPDAGNWSITAYVQNIENNQYAVNDARFPIGNFIAQTTAPPRLYGARLNVKF